ncbi:alpha/beta hydrolase [Actinoplanes sp. NPDC051633]|uniref:alpha/beta hydrolase n=1 Tax=Actinoplanes sp. NPDC051633 TaxID=3155670 RepID=UPI003417086B
MKGVVFPGGNYGPNHPLLHYAGLALEVRGAEVHRVTWPMPADRKTLAETDFHAFVDAVAATELDAVGGAPIVIGKSFGTYAAAQVARRGLVAVWYTPLLHAPEAVAGLEAATAPFLLIGGTNDPHAWDGDLARRLTPHVLEIEGADHGMMVPGPLSASAAVLGRVTDAVERFLDDQSPSGAPSA